MVGTFAEFEARPVQVDEAPAAQATTTPADYAALKGLCFVLEWALANVPSRTCISELLAPSKPNQTNVLQCIAPLKSLGKVRLMLQLHSSNCTWTFAKSMVSRPNSS